MFNIQYNFRARYLVTIKDENQLKVYGHHICNFKEAFLVIKASKRFIGKSRTCDMTQMMDGDISDYVGHTILVGGDDIDLYMFQGLKLSNSVQKIKL